MLHDNDWRQRTGLFDAGSFGLNMDTINSLKSIAEKCGSTPAHLAINWLLSKDAVISVIAGATNSEQVRDNVNSQHGDVGAEHIAAADALTIAQPSRC